MQQLNGITLGLAITAILASSAALADGTFAAPVRPVLEAPTIVIAPKVVQPKAPKTSIPSAAKEFEPAVNSSGRLAGFDTNGVFSGAKAVTPSSTTLSPPVSIVYAGSSPAISVNDTGSSKAVQATINNTSNTSSALYGQTNGAGGGVTGYNGGTTGFAGKFGITNNNSTQPAVLASTTGLGPAITATATNASNSSPAVLAKGGSDNYAFDGEGGFGGLYANADNYAVVGITDSGTALYGSSSSGYGSYASSSSGYGSYAYSSSGTGVYGYSSSGTGIYAYSGSSYALNANAGGSSPAVNVTSSSSGSGINITTQGGTGVNITSATGYGVFANSTNSYALIGEDHGSGYGVYGYSSTGYSGYFAGKVGATSYVTLSDRNAKTNFKAVDGKTILDRVSQLPISSWDFKTDLKTRHLGPMAQDFHAAFGLNGDDDKHINLTDIAGVNLAAVQELAKQMKAKDAEIAALKADLRMVNETMTARFAVLERQLNASTQKVKLEVKAPGSASWQ